MGILWEQKFGGPTTPEVYVKSTSISGNAGTKRLTGTAGMFSGFTIGKGAHTYGQSDSQDGSYVIDDIAGDGSWIQLSYYKTTGSGLRSIQTFSAGPSIVVRSGMLQSEIPPLFWNGQETGSTIENPSLLRIGFNSNEGSYLEKFTPPYKLYSGQNGFRGFFDLLKLAGMPNPPNEFYFAYWCKFKNGKASGTLDSSITAGTTASLTFTLDTGEIREFPTTKDLPYADTGYASETTDKEYAQYFMLGDEFGNYELAGYATRSGAGPYTLNTLGRGLRGTTAQAWPAGTRVTICYECADGHKMPGFHAGDENNLDGGTNIASARPGYMSFNYDDTPNTLGSPAFYCYYGSTGSPPTENNAKHRWLGVQWTPAGYGGGAKLWKWSQWDAIECYLKMNSAKGVADGIARVWWHGVLVLEKTDIVWASVNAIFDTWEILAFSTHWGKTYGEVAQKEERFLITGMKLSTTPINIHLDPPPYGVSQETGESKNLVVKTGTYTGNGTSQSPTISGETRVPKLVIIKANAAQYSVFRTDLMSDTAYIAAAQANITAITALSAGGFTVNSHATVNTNAVDYYWVAFFGDDANHFGTFQYTPDGTDDYTLTGFLDQPNWAITKSSNAVWPCVRFSSEASGNSINTQPSASPREVTDGIKSFTGDGMVLGTNTMVNVNAVVFNGFWFSNLADYIATGGYTGDGADSRTIDISDKSDESSGDFLPDFVLTMAVSTANYVVGRWAVADNTDLSFRLHNLSPSADYIQDWNANGFELGTNNVVNQNTVTFKFIAIRTNPNTFGGAANTRIVKAPLLEGIRGGLST